jgi:hypothetical protein
VGGGSPDNTGYFAFADIVGGSFNATGLTQLSATARLDDVNAGTGFIINLFDGTGRGALTATFSESNLNFTTGTVQVTAHPEGGDISNIQYFGIAGIGTTAPFRISFDNISISAIPEPGTYAALAGMLALGFVFWRRRAVQI